MYTLIQVYMNITITTLYHVYVPKHNNYSVKLITIMHYSPYRQLDNVVHCTSYEHNNQYQ